MLWRSRIDYRRNPFLPFPPRGEPMQFKLLGPLEVINKDQSLPLNGNTQRATLGFLLLHANSVVATSQLLKALWPVDMPMTGRKMLQNAVSGLRGTFSIGGNGPDSA